MYFEPIMEYRNNTQSRSDNRAKTKYRSPEDKDAVVKIISTLVPKARMDDIGINHSTFKWNKLLEKI